MVYNSGAWTKICVLSVFLTACFSETTSSSRITAGVPAAPLFILGQDLGAIRGYMESHCCVRPDGMTAYVNFYDVRSAADDFGGLGIDLDGLPVAFETDWGSGPVNAHRTATEYAAPWLAIGLSITENEHPGGLDEIVAGERDAEIQQLAVFAKSIDARILLRIGYEFDGHWNQGYENAPRYIAAFQRIVDGLRAANVSNVQTVWQGAASTTDVVLDQGRHDNVQDWYPGDDYVDWLGLSWFMHPDEQPRVELTFSVPTPLQLANEILALARQVQKPVLIAEAAPQAYDLRDNSVAHHSPLWDGPAATSILHISDDRIWNGWFQPLFDFMNANADVIRGLAYINVRWDAQDMWDAPYESGYWGDTRVEVNGLVSSRFNDAIVQWRGR